MHRIKVESSSISEIGYDEKQQVLEVKFTRGAVYKYLDVPEHEVFNLIFAESIGSYFSKNIAKKYKYEQMSE